jgi:UDP-N-acetyl-D-mannosaminuronic acid dehydrogenase
LSKDIPAKEFIVASIFENKAQPNRATSVQRVSVIGLGYIGLPTAAVFAAHGIQVLGTDINSTAVDTINQGKIHIIEPDLESAVHQVVSDGNFRAFTSVQGADAFIIAVPTPFKDDHQPDLSYVKGAAEAVAKVLVKGNLVILESTSPVGTTEQISRWLAQLRPDLKFPHQYGEEADIHLAYCPERVLPGKILQELVSNDRVIGGMTELAAQKAEDLYKTFVKGECLKTNARTAEMCKLTENSFRDVNIAFANELSLICDKLGINVWDLIKLANHHPRVKILQPGPGVGGHCIAVDPWFIVSSAPQQSKLIRTAREVNDGKPHYVLEKVREAAKKFEKPKIALLGLAFKANVDDLRESPALEITTHLAQEEVGTLYVVEPHVSVLPSSLELAHVYKVDMDEAVEKADIIVVLVDHSVFKEAPLNLKDKVVIDTRGLLQKH